nr:uncharacterized protein LOC109431839 [Aedes albopictus]
MSSPLLEICIDSFDSAVAAIRGGADRLELCAALSEGGLTPSVGLLREIRRFTLENVAQQREVKLYAMVRCRRGSDFCYSEPELRIMLHDLELLAQNGADGFVFGALDEAGNVHREHCGLVVAEASKHKKPVTFHRAFDCTDRSKMVENLELVGSLGFTTLLSSGLERTAMEGIQNLAEMVKFVSENERMQLTVMPGSGVSPRNVQEIVQKTGCRAVHASARSLRKGPKGSFISMGGNAADGEGLLVCDETIVREIKNLLISFSAFIIREEMVHRSGNRRKLQFSDSGSGTTPPPKEQVPSVSVQKDEQKAAQLKNKMDASVDALSRCCETAKGKIVRIRKAIETANHDYKVFNIHALRLYVKTVDAAYEEYNDFQNKIYQAAPSRKDEFEATFVEFEELYEYTRISLCEIIDAYEESLKTQQMPAITWPETSSLPSGSGASQLVRPSPTIVLQQAALPSFDGKYEHWFKFKQMFRDIVDKCTGDSAATKLHFLDKALIGKAQGAIDPQLIRDNDYDGAWKSLTEQFENLPVLINDTIMKLLNLKPMTTESFQQLKTLIDEVEKSINSLEFHQLKMDKLSEAIVTTLISTKLDQDTRKIWESNVKRGKLPVYKDMIVVLRNQQHVLERCESFKSTQKGKNPPTRTAQPAATKTHTATIQKSEDCQICCEVHTVEKCDVFKKLDVKGRFDKAKQLGLCFACLKKGHRTANCKTNAKCPKCSRRHHLLLHQEEQTSQDEQKPPLKKPDEDGGSSSNSVRPATETTVANCLRPCDTAVSPKHVLLATAIVNVFDVDGDQHKCRVLLDSGAMTNFVFQRLADLLQLKKNYVNVPVTGVNGMKTLVKFQVQCKVKSRVSEEAFCLDYLVVPKVTGALPVTKLNVDHWPIPPNLELADPKFFEPSRVDMKAS